MKKAHLLSTIAAAALLGVGAAGAQGTNQPVAPERAPAAQQNAPAEKVAPSMRPGERRPVGTTGQGTAEKLQPGTGGNAEVKERGTMGASPHKEGAGSESGAKVEEHGGAKGGVKAGAKARSDDQTGKGALKSESDSRAKTQGAASGSADSKSAAGDAGKEGKNGKNGTTGQGAAASGAKLSTEQRTKITTVIQKQRVEPATLNISVEVGTHIPSRVHYYALPTEVVEIYPEWRGYYYILVSNQIVIVDPDTRAVVYIIDA